MDKIISMGYTAIMLVINSIITSLLQGSILYLLYPTLGQFFPILIAGGVTVIFPTWWMCVKLVFMLNILLKTSIVVNNHILNVKDN